MLPVCFGIVRDIKAFHIIRQLEIGSAISTDDEFARARQFTSIYNDELSRLNKEYGEKRKREYIISEDIK